MVVVVVVGVSFDNDTIIRNEMFHGRSLLCNINLTKAKGIDHPSDQHAAGTGVFGLEIFGTNKLMLAARSLVMTLAASHRYILRSLHLPATSLYLSYRGSAPGKSV